MKKLYYYILNIILSLSLLNGCKKEDPIDFNSALDYEIFTDERDGYTYKSIQIGNQVWMAENLQYDEDPDDHEENIDPNVYGRLYYSGDIENVCPNGWHLPNKEEWQELVDYLGGEEVAGGKMKENGFLHWLSPNTGATNSSGFSALPAGIYDMNEGGYGALREKKAFFWIKSQEYTARNIQLSYDSEEIDMEDYGSIDNYCSVRCVKD